MVMLMLSVTAYSYNVVNLPQRMTFDEAFGIFSSSEITKATISNYADRKYVDLTREEINSLFANMKSMELVRDTNPMPFRGTALNLYTADGNAKSYYVNSGIQIGLFGSSNYICYKAVGDDATYATNIETMYQDSTKKKTGDVFFRATGNDFLKLPSEVWAHIPIKEAAEHNVLPYEFVHKYENNITREEFCVLLANLIKVSANYASLEEYMDDMGVIYFSNNFADCEGRDNSINMLYALGIVSGKSDNLFDPDGAITREEAAALLCRTAEKFMYIEIYGDLNFADAAYVSPWAHYFCIWVNEKSIMNGNDGMFLPKDNYTVLQAITTVNRLYKVIERHQGF